MNRKMNAVKLLFVVLTLLFPAPTSFAIEPMSDPTNPQGPVVPFVADASQETTVIEVRPGESIQAAIDQARDGDVILLSDGTYDYSDALTVNKAITLRGQTREGVILRSNIVVDTNGATIENLTVDPAQFVYSGGVQGGIGTFRALTSIAISGQGNSVKNCTIKGFSPLLIENAQDTLLDHNLILDRAALWSLRGYENAALRPAVWIRDSNGVEILHNTISVPDRVSYLWGYRFADGHGVVESSSDNIVIKNSIIVAEGGSDFQSGSAIVYDGAAPTVTYSIVRTGDLALLSQTGVLNADPLFVSDTDFRLRPGSPAIDAGDPNSPPDPDGTRADIGAFYLPPIPEGWTRARSNPNYAFRIEREDGGSQGSRSTLKLMDLRSREEQILVQVSTGSLGFISEIFDVSPDGFPGGPVVIYQFGGTHPSHGTSSHTVIQRISNPDEQEEIFHTGSVSLTGIEFSENQAVVHFEKSFASAVLEENYTVTGQAGSLEISDPVSRVLVAREGLHIDSDTPLVILREAHLTGPDDFTIVIYDASEGADRLRFLRTVTVSFDSGGQYTFVDAYTTGEGRQIVSVGLDIDHGNTSLLVDARTGEELRLEGAIISAQYLDSFAYYTVVTPGGTKKIEVVSLDTLEILGGRDRAIGVLLLFIDLTETGERIRYQALARTLEELGDAGLAAGVIAEIAVGSYQATRRVDTRLISAIRDIDFLSAIYRTLGGADFWTAYELTNREVFAILPAIRSSLERRIRHLLIVVYGGVETPQRDKILYHVRERGQDFLIIYDLRETRILRRNLGNFGFGGIKAVTPDGQYAIVASSVNAIYIVPIRNTTQPTRVVHLPSVLVSVTSPFGNRPVIVVTLRNGRHYILDYLTGRFREIPVHHRLSRA